MRNIGIHFKKVQSNKYDLSIFQLLGGVKFQKYIWQVANDEVYILNNLDEMTDEYLFSDDEILITGEELEQRIKNKNSYPIFLTLRGFPKTEDTINILKTKIMNASDFINSNCEFLLSIVDGFDISILCKDEDLLKELHQHVQDLGYVDTKYLTETNSGTF
ncbi:DUF2691 family protein [Bacillus toyonensis]|uniref:DUF2691 family protein n=1 Tax=Bacillus toyonensis TaxID=155322 RepID=UPI000BF8E388|nr:DUF2691 family protein [Bacillus toyonensis]PGB55369.1 hypothetical protein COM00_28900 [Bacillus toyonensis]